MAKQNTENGQRTVEEEGGRAEEGYPGEQQTTYALWEGEQTRQHSGVSM